VPVQLFSLRILDLYPMKKSNLIRVGDAINELFKQEKLDVKISRFAVKNAWKEIVGEHIAKNTLDISFHESTLFLTLRSAALKQELSFSKQQIIDSINRFSGSKLIKEIVFK
jgi:predicted nucleic acid-binding Zn ribbon protein